MAPSSTTTFSSLPLAAFLQETIRTVGYETPTPIQAEAIPTVVEGKDLIGLAQTGTGKTAAFVLPLINRLSGEKKTGVRALILAPTRELAEQINDVLKLFLPRTGLKSTTVYGGVSHRNQITALKGSPAIVVACPGRLKDHMQGRTIDLSKVEMLVLDEADRMLDMGFLPDIRHVVRALPAEGRQTLLFSATMPDEIETLSRELLTNPVVVRVKTETPVALVSHSMYNVRSEEKGDKLRNWLSQNPEALAVVFTKMKHTAKKLGTKLSDGGVDATSLHGNLTQAARQRALNGFREGKYRVLIATDIAARGIDVEGVTHVLNYDMPDTLEAYIHRTGRAGRASRTGEAVSFVTRADMGLLRQIEKWLKSPVARLGGESAESTEVEGDDTAPKRERRGRPQGQRDRGFSPRGDRGFSPRGDRRPERRQFSRGPRDAGERRPFRDEQGESRPEFRERRDDTRGPRPEGRGGAPRHARGEGRKDFGRQRWQERGERPERSTPRFEEGQEQKAGGQLPSDRSEGARPRGTGRPERSGAPRGGAARGGRSEGARGGRGFGDRSERGSYPRQPRAEGAGAGRGFGDRRERSFNRGSERGGSRGFGRGAPRSKTPFRGQKDIDPNSEHVYREPKPHFIGQDEQQPRGSGRFSRGRSNGGSRSGGKGFPRGGGRGPRRTPGSF
jgi:superfamily II DNA/RNA helicase